MDATLSKPDTSQKSVERIVRDLEDLAVVAATHSHRRLAAEAAEILRILNSERRADA